MRKFIFICIAAAALTVPSHAERLEQDSALACTRGTVPLKSCLVDVMVSHVDITAARDNNSRWALTKIDEVIADHGKPEQVEKLIDRLMSQITPKDVKSEDDYWSFYHVLNDVGLYGTPAQILTMLKAYNSQTGKLPSPSNAKLSPESPDESQKQIAALFNQLYLELALGKREKVESAFRQLSANKQFQSKPRNSMSRMALMLIKRGKPDESLNFIQATRDLPFHESPNTPQIIGGPYEPPPLLYLILEFLEKGDITSARTALNLCDTIGLYGFGCRGTLRMIKADERIGCDTYTKTYDDPQFLKWVFVQWIHRKEDPLEEPSPMDNFMGIHLGEYPTKGEFPKEDDYRMAWQILTFSNPSCAEIVAGLIEKGGAASIADGKSAQFEQFLRGALKKVTDLAPCTEPQDLAGSIRCKCKKDDFDCISETAISWLKERGENHRKMQTVYSPSPPSWNVYEALPDLKKIYLSYKKAGKEGRFKEVLDTLPPVISKQYKDRDLHYVSDAILFFNEIGDVKRQQEAEQFLHDSGQMSGLKKQELREKLLSGHADEALDYMQNVGNALEWALSADLPEDVQKKAFARLWPAYVTAEEERDGGWIKSMVEWTQKNNDVPVELKPSQIAELHEQDKKQKKNMAGLKYAHRIAKLLQPYGRTNPDYAAIRNKYPKALASLDEVLQ